MYGPELTRMTYSWQRNDSIFSNSMVRYPPLFKEKFSNLIVDLLNYAQYNTRVPSRVMFIYPTNYLHHFNFRRNSLNIKQCQPNIITRNFSTVVINKYGVNSMKQSLLLNGTRFPADIS